MTRVPYGGQTRRVYVSVRAQSHGSFGEPDREEIVLSAVPVTDSATSTTARVAEIVRWDIGAQFLRHVSERTMNDLVGRVSVA